MSNRTCLMLLLLIVFVSIALLQYPGCNGSKSAEIPENPEFHRSLTSRLDGALLARRTMTIDCGTIEARKFLMYGWSPAEHDELGRTFVWSDRESSSFLLPLSSSHDSFIRFTALPYQREDNEPQRVTVSVNEVPVSVVTMTSGWRTYEVPVSSQHIREGNNAVTFTYSWTVSPRQLGISNDLRRLGICVDLIRITDRPEAFEPVAVVSDLTKAQTVQVGGREVPSLQIPPTGSLTFRMLVPHRTWVRFRLGQVAPNCPVPVTGESSSPVVFEVSVADWQGENRQIVFSRTISDSTDGADVMPGMRVSEIMTTKEISGGREILLTLSTRFAGESSCVQPAFFIEPVVIGQFKREEMELATTKPSQKSPVFVFGLDGMTWDIVRPMIANGELPNISRLIDRGNTSPFRSLLPSKSPMLWTSIATGKIPEKHGIDDYVSWDSERRERIPVTVNLRKTKALWNIFSDLGRRVMVLGWWPSWPAEEVNGFMVSDRRGGRDLPHQTWPEDLFLELEKSCPPEPFDASRFFPEELDLKGDMLGTHRLSKPERAAIVEQLIRVQQRDSYFVACAEQLLKREHPDFFAIYLNGVDPVCHLFWRYSMPQLYGVSAEEARLFSGVIAAYYRYTDELLGRLMAYVPEDAIIFAVSDHGFGGEFNRNFKVDINRLLELTGFLKRQSGDRIDESGTLIRQGPSIDASLDQRLIISSHVKSDPEKLARLRRDVQERIGDIRSLKTNGSPFTLKWEATEENDFTIEIDYRPMLDEPLMIMGREIPFSEIFPEDFVSGSHGWGPDGIFIAAGPMVRQGSLLSRDIYEERNSTIMKPGILDIAPTILYLAGFPLAVDMDGQLYFPLLKDRFRAEHSLHYLESYDSIGSSPNRQQSAVASEQDESIRNQLKSLGYIN